MPDLPDAHVEAFFDLPMGMLTKLPVEIRGTRLGLNSFDDLLIERRAQHDIYFLCFPFDLDLMVGFVGGDFAWELSAAGEEAGVDFVSDRLCDIFGSDLRKSIGRSTMTNWGAERWVRGAYAAARPGQAGATGWTVQATALTPTRPLGRFSPASRSLASPRTPEPWPAPPAVRRSPTRNWPAGAPIAPMRSHRRRRG